MFDLHGGLKCQKGKKLSNRHVDLQPTTHGGLQNVQFAWGWWGMLVLKNQLPSTPIYNLLLKGYYIRIYECNEHQFLYAILLYGGFGKPFLYENAIL